MLACCSSQFIQPSTVPTRTASARHDQLRGRSPSPALLFGDDERSIGLAAYGDVGLSPGAQAPAGTYLPVYTLTRDRKLELDGVKLRALFAVPHAETRRVFYGVNFELSFNSRHWDESRYGGEIRPIVGTRLGPWDLIVNPILDTSFDGFSRLDFAPSLRVAYNKSPGFALAVEHYADFGQLRHLESGARQEHNVFGVADYARKLFDLEAGIGFGLTKASDKLVLKTILSHTF